MRSTVRIGSASAARPRVQARARATGFFAAVFMLVVASAVPASANRPPEEGGGKWWETKRLWYYGDKGGDAAPCWGSARTPSKRSGYIHTWTEVKCGGGGLYSARTNLAQSRMMVSLRAQGTNRGTYREWVCNLHQDTWYIGKDGLYHCWVHLRVRDLPGQNRWLVHNNARYREYWIDGPGDFPGVMRQAYY